MTPASKSRPAASASDEPASFFAVTAALVMLRVPPEVAESARDLAALSSARAAATLERRPETPCPARVVRVGGDCLATLARAIVPEAPGSPPRFEPQSPAEGEVLCEAGDGAVTLSGMLASHLPEAEASELDCGMPEVSATFFGNVDHHGVYSEPTFQSLLLRLLLRPPRGARS